MAATDTSPTGVNQALVGHSYAPTEIYLVERGKIAEFATATGATHPAHTAVEAARELGYDDVVAPPTFAVVLSQRAERVYIASPESGIDFSRVVHADERITAHRPIVAGDRLVTTVHVDKIIARTSMSLVTTRCEIAEAGPGGVTDPGAPVSTVTSTLAIRGEDS